MTHALRIFNAILSIIGLMLLAIFGSSQAFAQAGQIPNAEACFQATTGVNGMIGTLGVITTGSGGAAGTYVNVPLTGGSGTTATANITVLGGAVVGVAILNPGINYVVGNTLSASSGAIGGTTGFSVPVASISINSSLAGGSVGFYIPGTSTVKQTWQDAAQTILNTNPVKLDANGCAIIYGAGIYRQILWDSLGNEVWDQLTTVIPISPFWAGVATGTANAITVTDGSFSGLDGQAIQFIASGTNTGPTTINPSSFGNISIVKNTPSGPIALAGGEIVGGSPGNLVTVVYSASNNEFFLQAYPGPMVVKNNALISVGAPPVATGTCTITTQTGGPTAGSFIASGSCAAGTVILTFLTAAPHGWSCSAHDLTTPADAMNETAFGTTSVTLTGTMAASDEVTFQCQGF
jgi:hypothetical protein